MTTELRMPQLGYDMEHGTVVRWLKTVGETIEIGEAVAEIETDKAVVEFESIANGVLLKLLVEEGTMATVGKAICVIGEAGEEYSEDSAAADEDIEDVPSLTQEQTTPHSNIQDDPSPAEGSPIKSTEIQVRASPVARRLADEYGIDLTQVAGTGPGGRITKNDITELTSGKSPLKETATEDTSTSNVTVPLSKMRQQISRVTSRSKQEIPHFYVSADIDMSEAMRFRQQINQGLSASGIKVSVNDMVLKASIEAIKLYPNFNASYTSDGLETHEQINIGISIAGEEGLIVPAVMDCASKSLVDLARATKDLIARSKNGTLQSSEYTGGTFSTSNMGMFEVSSFVAIIQPPQSAMLAVGTVSDRVVVKAGEIVMAQIMTATLSADHRVVDGAEAARFIGVIKQFLENPMSLLVLP